MKGMKGKAATVVPVATVAATAVAAKGAEEGHNFVRSASLLAALKSFFGYTTFRHSQERVINAVLDKRSALLVSATGATVKTLMRF
jgi:superfamily II DNA helicase RecQ